MNHQFLRPCLKGLILSLILSVSIPGDAAEPGEVHVATFAADVTIPIGHRCMGILPTKAKEIIDPLETRGLIITGVGKPVAIVAVDWCEIRNGAYDEWRDTIAKAASTTRERVMVCSLHQHDAPVCDREAQLLLDSVGMKKELYDPEFHAACLKRISAAVKDALTEKKPVTHLGLGETRVSGIASSRRVVLDDGSIAWSRYSASGGNEFHANAPDGPIDPNLKTITFFNGNQPLVMLHSYAVHPMSFYGRGGVSSDFVGLARRRMQREHPRVFQIYVSGCSGDVTAGKYNDATPASRELLTQRLFEAMEASWQSTQRQDLKQVEFRNATYDLPFHEADEFEPAALKKVLHDESAKEGDRILAAMSLSSLQRKERGQPLELPCLDLRDAQIILFPGESFVGYQLMAQEMRPDSFVMCIGYGECWPGYIPTKQAFEENFNHGWRWVGRGSEAILRPAMRKVLNVSDRN
ncbi:MAG: hypothetical protein HUJ26_11785 [Planctomycetaceae bacterium]|nr:hypothetical protein [Planctomycetaceae bacterium]